MLAYLCEMYEHEKPCLLLHFSSSRAGWAQKTQTNISKCSFVYKMVSNRSSRAEIWTCGRHLSRCAFCLSATTKTYFYKRTNNIKKGATHIHTYSKHVPTIIFLDMFNVSQYKDHQILRKNIWHYVTQLYICRLQLTRRLILYRHHLFFPKRSQIGVHRRIIGQAGDFSKAHLFCSNTYKTSKYIETNKQPAITFIRFKYT